MCGQLQISDLGLAMSLFNNQVPPCLTYAAEVWLPYLTADRVTCKIYFEVAVTKSPELQYIFCLASTCHTPGTCLGAPVCSAWRSAAAGCSDTIRLLYHAGYGPADQSSITWLESNSQQLGALTLGSSNSSDNSSILAALAESSAAAQAAGRPCVCRRCR
jgi:hypothetical protein